MTPRSVTFSPGRDPRHQIGALRQGRRRAAYERDPPVSFWQVHFLNERLEARITVQARDQQVDLDVAQSPIVLLVSSVQPLERLILFAPPGVSLGDLIGRFLLVLRGQLIERLP